MSDLLRAMAVSVIEPRPGVFRWVILKSMGAQPLYDEHDVSPEAFVSWAGALDAGVQALKWLAGDDKTGPRADASEQPDAPGASSGPDAKRDAG